MFWHFTPAMNRITRFWLWLELFDMQCKVSIFTKSLWLNHRCVEWTEMHKDIR